MAWSSQIYSGPRPNHLGASIALCSPVIVKPRTSSSHLLYIAAHLDTDYRYLLGTLWHLLLLPEKNTQTLSKTKHVPQIGGRLPAHCHSILDLILTTTAITTTTITTITHLCSPSSSYGCWQELLQSRATLRELSTTSLHSCLAYFDREHRPTVQHLFTFHNSVKEDVLCLYFEYWLFGEGTNPYPKPQ